MSFLSLWIAFLYPKRKKKHKTWRGDGQIPPQIMSEMLWTSHTLIGGVGWYMDRLMWSRSWGLTSDLRLALFGFWGPSPPGFHLSFSPCQAPAFKRSCATLHLGEEMNKYLIKLWVTLIHAHRKILTCVMPGPPRYILVL